jgi:hypothetical protein
MQLVASPLNGPDTLALITLPFARTIIATVAVPVCPCVHARTAAESRVMVAVTCAREGRSASGPAAAAGAGAAPALPPPLEGALACEGFDCAPPSATPPWPPVACAIKSSMDRVPPPAVPWPLALLPAGAAVVVEAAACVAGGGGGAAAGVGAGSAAWCGAPAERVSVVGRSVFIASVSPLRLRRSVG